MALTFTCACGKSYSVPDEFAGRRTKCKACGVGLTVPTVFTEDDIEIVEEVASPAPAPVKAAVVDDEPVRKRRKKRPKYEGMTRDEERETVEQMNATMGRQVRFLRSVAFLVGGLVTLTALAAMHVALEDQPILFAVIMSGWTGLAIIAAGVFAACAVARGAVGLVNSYLEN